MHLHRSMAGFLCDLALRCILCGHKSYDGILNWEY